MVKQNFLRCLETEICSKMLGKSDFGNPKNHVKSRGENEGFRTEGISPIHRDFLQTYQVKREGLHFRTFQTSL